MAWHIRRLIFWSLGCVAVLVMLALLGIAALLFLVDPDAFRGRIEAEAGRALGRRVTLTGTLRWRLGSQIYIGNDGGQVANATGFGAQPFASWSRLRFGVAARPLFHKQLLIDRIQIDGLQLRLQRNAQGAGNWQFGSSAVAGSGNSADGAVTARVAAVALRNGDIRYQDAASGADWRVTGLDFSVDLPTDIGAADRQFGNLTLAGRVSGVPLLGGGVPVRGHADSLRLTADTLDVPAFDAHWADAQLRGGVHATLGATPAAQGKISVQAPSLRQLLATASVVLPPMRDSATLGALQFNASVAYAGGAVMLTDLHAALDDTRLNGTASVQRFAPPALRFDLTADHIDLDRYQKPDDVKSEPFELPLARLQALDAKGVLRIGSATVAGAAAKEVRIDVD